MTYTHTHTHGHAVYTSKSPTPYNTAQPAVNNLQYLRSMLLLSERTCVCVCVYVCVSHTCGMSVGRPDAALPCLPLLLLFSCSVLPESVMSNEGRQRRVRRKNGSVGPEQMNADTHTHTHASETQGSQLQVRTEAQRVRAQPCVCGGVCTCRLVCVCVRACICIVCACACVCVCVTHSPM